MKKQLLFLFLFLGFLWALPQTVFAADISSQTAVEDVPYFSTIREAAEYVRDGLINRSFEQVTDFSIATKVRLPVEFAGHSSLEEQFGEIIREHTGNPKGGDSLTMVRLQISAVAEGGYCTAYIEATYEWSHEQDKELDAAVNQLLAKLDLSGKTDYEKVRAFYDWMCSNITYDYSLTNHSAYDALCKRNVVCSGYARLLYRLCLEVGIDCRYCSGETINWFGTPEGHAWNVVQVDGQYYYVDSTWGTMIDGSIDYYYLLKGVDGMCDHEIPVIRWNLEIGDYCTVAEEDYPIPEQTQIMERGQVSETISYELTSAGKLFINGTGTLGTVSLENSNYVKEVVIGEGITAVSPYAFEIFSTIISVTFPDSLIVLGEGAFVNSNIFSLKISANLQQIGKAAFGGRGLRFVEVDPANPYYIAIGDSLYTKDGKTLVRYAGILDDAGNQIREYAVPLGTETIGAHAFGGNNVLRKVTLPNTVKVIEEKAFYLSNEVVVNLPDSLVSIGAYAFDGCNAMSEVYIGPNVSHIGESALTSFRHTTIMVHPDNPYFVCVDGVLFSKDMTRLIRYPVAWTDTTYVIPEGVTEIAASAFSTYESTSVHSANLFSVSFPDSLRVIGNGAFAMQCNLRELKLPSKLEIISDGAFGNGATSLQTIVIPDSVTYVGQGAFWQHGAETIIVGKGVKEIREQAFHRDNASLDYGTPTNVFFRGERPAMENLLGGDTLFGPTYADKLSTCVYFPKEHTDSWAPGNEVTWKPYADYEEYYPIRAYHESNDGKLHTYALSITPTGCSRGGKGIYHCALCGDTYEGANGHVEVSIPGKAATCTETGLTDGVKCSVCGEILTHQEIISATGHTYEAGRCTMCGEKDPNLRPAGLLGDADGSGEVDYVDAMLVLQYHTGVIGNDALALSQCDVDGSGEVDYVDAMMILQYHTGVISGF